MPTRWRCRWGGGRERDEGQWHGRARPRWRMAITEDEAVAAPLLPSRADKMWVGGGKQEHALHQGADAAIGDPAPSSWRNPLHLPPGPSAAALILHPFCDCCACIHADAYAGCRWRTRTAASATFPGHIRLTATTPCPRWAPIPAPDYCNASPCVRCSAATVHYPSSCTSDCLQVCPSEPACPAAV